MRRVVVQICAALAWIAIIIPGAFSQTIDFSSLTENNALGYGNSPVLSSADVVSPGSGTVYGLHDAFSRGTGRGTFELRENLLQPRGASLFTDNSRKGMITSYSIDPQIFCVIATDARYVSAYPSRSETACLLIDYLAVPAQTDSAPVSQPVMMFLGGIGLIGLSNAKLLKKGSAPENKATLIVQGKSSYSTPSQVWKQYESKAA